MSQKKTYSYAAIAHATGERRTGTMEAIDETAVRNTLRGHGMRPVTVTQAKAKTGARLKLGGGKKMKAAELALFTKQLGQALRLRQPPVTALRVIAKGWEKKRPGCAVMFNDIADAISDGKPFSVAFAAHPEVFDNVFCAYLEAGDESGQLADAVTRLSVQTSKHAKIAAATKSAMRQPKILAVFAGLVAIGMAKLLIPKLMPTYEAAGAQLPLPTRVMMWLEANTFLVIGLVAVLMVAKVVGGRLLKKRPEWGQHVERHLWKLPVFGPLGKQQVVWRWMSTLAGAQASQLPLPRSLELSGLSSGSVWLAEITPRLCEGTRAGRELSGQLEAFPGVFDPLLVSVIRTAEDSGDLAEALRDLAETLGEDVDVSVGDLKEKVGTLATLGIGLLVGGVVLAVYMPVFTMLKVMLAQSA